MAELNSIEQVLTSRNRIEEVQGKEKIGSTACIRETICMRYCIAVGLLAFGEWHGSRTSRKWLSEMLKVILQIQAEECESFIHLITWYSTLKYFRKDIEQGLDDRTILTEQRTFLNYLKIGFIVSSLSAPRNFWLCLHKAFFLRGSYRKVLSPS
jgi:hypothetical protein